MANIQQELKLKKPKENLRQLFEYRNRWHILPRPEKIKWGVYN